MIIRVGLIGGDELVRRGLESMLRTLGGFELGSFKDRMREPIDIAPIETFGTPLDDTTLSRAVADPFIRRVAVFTWNHHPGLVDDVLGDGVSGYLGKSLTATQLGRALRSIHLGEAVVAPPLGGHPVSGPPVPSEADILTTRERETLGLIATGRSNDEIAQEMQISLNSVKSYIRSAYRKTGVQSRSQAVLWAVSHGVRADVLERA
ncbi:response regulator transcription factor [Mycobacterium cookii]|uniref:Response regulator transcription factor n=1 Tax=Nocardioides furvisabuli TaxID=375542 RepID=A0ABP5IP99_9ACTN|nr:response regulator transcription factor [Nocardioides furvisabuli]